MFELGYMSGDRTYHFSKKELKRYISQLQRSIYPSDRKLLAQYNKLLAKMH